MASGGYKAPYERLQSEIGSLSLTDPRRPNTRGAEGNTRRIVLLGKSGSGKSSLANTLFGEKDTFKVGDSPSSETKKCESKTTAINGRSIQLIDTPGLFDTNLNSEELKSEILRCIVECAPGPHAFLLVLKVERYTQQEEAVVNQMEKEYFGKEALKYTTVVFTHGDQLKEGVKIEDWLKENKSLKNLVDKCKGGCFVIDNKYWNKPYVSIRNEYRNNQNQIEQLLETIDQTVRENGGGCYTNEMLQGVQEEIKREKEKLKQSSPNISEETLLIMAKEAAYRNLKKTIRFAIGGTLLGVFLGAAGAAGAAFFIPVAAAAKVVGVGAVASIGGALGGVGGAKVSKMTGSMDEDVKNAMKKLK